MMVNLFMAVFWLLIGGGLLLWQRFNAQAPYANAWGSGWSLGWVGVLLAVYNLARWWSVRWYRARQRAAEEAEHLRQQAEHARRPAQQPDPNFNFTDQLRGPESERHERE